MPDTITTKDYFDLAQQSYDDSLVPSLESTEGWNIIDVTQNDATGYAAVAYQAPDGKIIIAHKGSDNVFNSEDEIDVDWVNSNHPIAKGEIPDQFGDADAFTKQIMNNFSGQEIEHTGHSLGGALSQMMGHKYNSKSTAFDPPGIVEVIQNNSEAFHSEDSPFEGAKEVNVDDFTTIVVKNSPVSGVNTQIFGDGLTKIDLNPESIDWNLPGHSMENIVKAFGEDGNISNEFMNNVSTESESDIHLGIEKIVEGVDSMEQGIQDVRDGISDGASGVEEGVQDVRDGISDGTGSVKEGVQDVRDGISDGADSVIDGVQDVRDGISDGSGSVKEGVQDVRDGISDGTSSVKEGVQDVRDGIVEGVDSVRDGIRQVVEGEIDEGLSSMKEGVQDMKDGIADGTDSMKEGIQDVRDGISNGAGSVKEGVQDMKDGIADGIDSMKQGVQDMTEGISDGVSSMKEGVQEMRNGIGEGVQEMKDGIVDGVDGFIDGVPQFVEGVAGVVGGLIDNPDQVRKVIRDLKDDTQKVEPEIENSDQAIEDLILEKKALLGEDDLGFTLPDELPATGADPGAIDQNIQDLTQDLEANMDLLFQKIEKYKSSIQGI